jgi:hypothetical protein
MRRCFPIALLALFAVTPAYAGGTGLAWDDCGSHGTSFKTFTCTTNSGADVLVASFVSPIPLDQLVGFEATVDLFSGLPAMPSWWSFTPGTGCRAGALSASTDFTSGPFSCADPWGGPMAVLWSYPPFIAPPDVARIRLVGTMAQGTTAAVDDTSEYYAFKLRIAHAKTVGATACAGCDVGMCIVLNSIKVVRAGGAGDYTLSGDPRQQLASWQCPGSMQVDAYHNWYCYLPCPTPVKSKTWGGVKSLYR